MKPLRGLMTLATMMLVAAMSGGADGAPAALGHAAEVKLFASTMATVKVVTGACPDMLPNAAYLAGLRDRLQITDADKPAFAEEGSAVAAMLGQGLAEATSRDAWCAAAFRLYGPAGSMIPGLFSR